MMCILTLSVTPTLLRISGSSGSSSIPFATANMSEQLAPAPESDPRWNSWPCAGKHTPGRYRNNQYATWRTCSRCALRVEYIPKAGYKGTCRQAGPRNTVLATAAGEIRMEMEASEVTEKYVNDKCMEVAGRMRQQGYNVTTREPMVRKTPATTSSTTPLPRTPTKTTTPTTTGMMEDRVLKGSQPKAIAMKKSPIENSKGNGAQGSGVSPVNLTNEQIHQSLYEISQLELRMQAQWEKLMEEVSLRGLMEEDADSWDAGQNRKGQLAPSGED